jgi:hypothetical protein
MSTNRQQERANNNNSRDKNPHKGEPNINDEPTANKYFTEIDPEKTPEDRLLRTGVSPGGELSIFGRWGLVELSTCP